MSIFKKISALFGDNRKHSTPYEAFWNWFQQHEKEFYRILRKKGDINGGFFEPLLQQLNQIRTGYYFLAGMNHDTAELVFTADGDIKLIPFVEDLVAAAPRIAGWEFIASKPASMSATQSIKLGEFDFNVETLSFYADVDPVYPDSINLTVIHQDYTPEEDSQMVLGTYVFLDNYLGEVKSVTAIDSVNVAGECPKDKELIPIGKLKEYIDWREKEFVERYEGVVYDKDSDNYSLLEAQTEEGLPVLVIVNTGVMEWHGTASHPWILKFVFNYNGEENVGLPERDMQELMDVVEDELSELLPGDGSLNAGRETGRDKRVVYFVCRDFRAPARAAEEVSRKYEGRVSIEWDIYKDKYWQSLEKFRIEKML